jgi:hypothetical protein
MGHYGLAFVLPSANVGPVNSARRMPIKLNRGSSGCFGTLLVAGLLSCYPCNRGAAAALPAASEVTRRMIERAQAVAQAEQGPQYTYEKRSLLERLDASGQPVSSAEKLYQVTLTCCLPFNRLVKVQGRDLTAEELKKEQDREERFQRQFASTDRQKLVARKEALVTPELLDRYQFTVKERVILRDRPTLVLTFKPREGDLPSGTIQDKLLNGMAGTLWIDEGDADTARLVVNLVEPVSLGWFGWLGSLTRFELSLERQRMPDGVWVNTKQAFLMQCRKLATTLRFRATEESSGFRHVETKQ